jgi:hypothetical protein
VKLKIKEKEKLFRQNSAALFVQQDTARGLGLFLTDKFPDKRTQILEKVLEQEW